MVTQLHIFDFDNTLFRSPEKPDWWAMQGWWGRSESLNPPCVPERPGPEWWVGTTVADARRSISDPSVHTVLITGRAGKKFKHRVTELLSQAGLHFDEVHLAGGADNTLTFKLKLIDSLFERYPVARIEMWEDRVEHLGPFDTKLGGLGVEYEVHAVRAKPMAVLCGPGDTAARVARRYIAHVRG